MKLPSWSAFKKLFSELVGICLVYAIGDGTVPDAPFIPQAPPIKISPELERSLLNAGKAIKAFGATAEEASKALSLLAKGFEGVDFKEDIE